MEKLIQEAKIAYMRTYSPYSKFGVGAALLLKDGTIIHGTNIEISSFGLTNCAERSALFNAYSQGYRKEDIEKIAIIGNTEKPISPCGACRQVMSELMDLDCEVILANLSGDKMTLKVRDLLPYHFSSEDMKYGK